MPRLADDEQSRDEQRKRAQREQRAARQRRDAGRVGDGQVAHDADHGRVEKRAGQQRGHRRRAFAMRVGQPRMHRRETDLRPVADQHEKKGQRHHRGIEPGRDLLQRLPGHVVGWPEDERAAPIEQDSARAARG